MRIKFSSLFVRDYEHYEGVRKIQIYLMRLLYGLMFVFLGRDAWTYIFAHQGSWEPYEAMAWSVWAAFATLTLLGILQPVKMIPILLLEIFYKTLWLALVAYPLWRSGKLEGSSAEGITDVFLPIIVVFFIVPWGYVFRTYILGRKIESIT